MRQYERSGVTIDQCADCRGIFLDRGELERLLDANDAYEARRGGQDPERQQQNSGERGGGERGHGGTSGHGGSSGHEGYSGEEQGRKRRGGFLGGLFD